MEEEKLVRLIINCSSLSFLEEFLKSSSIEPRKLNRVVGPKWHRMGVFDADFSESDATKVEEWLEKNGFKLESREDSEDAKCQPSPEAL